MDYYRTYYTPGNAVIVCVGDFSADKLRAELEKAFGPVPAGDPPPPVRAVEPEQQGENRTVLKREAELPFVALAYHVPNLKSRDGYALEVLSAILASGKSARLYQRVVYEKRLARDVGASYELTSIDPGLFVVYGQPLPGKTAKTVETELLSQLESLKRSPVPQRELITATNGLEAGFVMGQDSLFYQGMLLGQYEMAGDWRALDSYLPGVRAVNAEDIMRVASFYFTAGNRTVGTLEPLPVSAGHAPAMRAHPSGPVR
jgi:zinc protease